MDIEEFTGNMKEYGTWRGSPRSVWFALRVLFLFSCLTVGPVVSAQDDNLTSAPPPDSAARGERPERRGGRDLLSRLNLSPAQLARIREIRQQNEGEARLLGQRARQTRRALDEAIYSDNADESMIEERAREAAAAQAAIVRRRALTELQVRRVLAPEQLSVLRDMRQQFRLRQRNRPPLDDDPRLRFPRERHNRRLREPPTGNPDN